MHSSQKSIKTNRTVEINGFNAIYYFEAGKSFSHPLEKHNFWEMVYVDCGQIKAFSNDMGYILTQGQVIFHEPMELHAHISDGKTVNNTMVIGFTSNSKNMDFFRGKIFNLDKTARSLLGLLFRESSNCNSPIDMQSNCFKDTLFGSSQLLQCYFTEFLIHLIRTEGGEQIQQHKDSRDIFLNSMTNSVVSYMQENVHLNLTIKDICQKFYIGKTQIYDFFQENIGKSPMEYYTELKITEAKKLLREEQYSITQIAELLSFSSIHTFSRAFKKNTGFSPSEYIRSIQRVNPEVCVNSSQDLRNDV